jgi:hypothetical protein
VEGESVQTLSRNPLRKIFFHSGIVALCFFLLQSLAIAQSWQTQAGSFLEPSQFTVAKALNDRTLRLEAGYGGSIASIGNTEIGLEGLIWSRLRVLSDFRFPVETADYFFGAFVTFRGPQELLGARLVGDWRFRLSHISSHIVDGLLDSVIGGSSSHYSREFLTLEREFRVQPFGIQLRGSLGLRYIFHQVTKVEPALQVPFNMDIRLLSGSSGIERMTSDSGVRTSEPEKRTFRDLFLTLSTASDPTGVSYAAAITLRTTTEHTNSVDLYVRYLYGPSLAGTEAGTSSNQIEFGTRLTPAMLW